MPFKSEKQRKWMHANKPKMAKKWEKEEKSVEEDRDYKAEYKKYGSSKKAKKYRAELNKYNRQKGTYGNGDGKDASHKGGKIVGFEAESTNRGRAEKSRLKKESITMLEAKFTDDTLASRIKQWRGKHKGTGIGYGHVLAHLAVHMKEMGWDKSYKEVASIAKELGKKKTVESVNEGFDKYRLGGLLDSKLKKRLERTIKIIGGKVDAVGDDYVKFRISSMDLAKLPSVIKKLDRNKNVWIGDKRNKNIWDRKRNIDKLGEGFGGELKGRDKQKFEKARKENAEQLGYKLTGITDIKEFILKETPAASAAAAMAAIQVQNAQGKKIKGTSALQSSDPRVQKKAKGIFQRLKDKFAKRKGKKDFEKQKKAIAKGADDYIRKLDKKESVNEINFSKISTPELVRQYKQMADERLFGAGALTFRLIAKELIKRKARLESVNEANASVIRKKLLKKFGEDPLYREFILAKTPKEQKKALKTLKSIRGDVGVRLMQTYAKKLQSESINEGFTKYHIRLTKTPGWYGVWDKNGKQKFEGDRKFVTKHLKKLKTRMGNFQLKSLIDVATKRKGKNIEFDVVESVNERMDKRQAAETLKQLGGNKFIAMTGAKNFGFGSKGMVFKIGRNSKGVNYVRIDLRNDLYDMEFIQMRAGKEKIKSKIKGVYNDQLQKIFTKHTGMYTRL
jgi:hypothetical protein